MQRYFAKLIDNKVVLEDSDVHHLLHVMRAKKGDHIEAVIVSKAYICEVFNTNPLEIRIMSEIDTNPELMVNVTLFFALAKGDKIDFVIQKATELGASKIVLVKTKRNVVKFTDDDFKRKLSRFNTIAKEASEQCHRNIIPEIIGIVDVREIPRSILCDQNFVAYEELCSQKPEIFIEKDTKSVSIFIGSEGGFEKDEILSLSEQGFRPVSLGKRILRTETAAIYSLSVFSYLIENK